MTDDRNRWLGPAPELPAARLVSLVPSLTDAVYRLGAGELVVGRTEYCIQPKGRVESVPVVGGTKNPELERVRELRPAVILANLEENTRRRVERLAATTSVWLTDPRGPADVPSLWRGLGEITGRREAARTLAAEVGHELEGNGDGDRSRRPRFVYWIWRDPWMAVGHDTYISRLLETAGWANALPAGADRYPKIAPDEALALAPDALLFSSEPYAFRLPDDLSPFGGHRPDGGGIWAVGDGARAVAVDGEVLSWYPSRTAEGLRKARALRLRW